MKNTVKYSTLSTCKQITNITCFEKRLKRPWKIKFTKLRQKAEYHKPPDAQAETDRNANLVFLSSLSDLKEWVLFGLAKGANIDTMTTAALFAEVKAYDATLKTPKITTET